MLLYICLSVGFCVQPHLDSFNFMLGEGIRKAVENLPIIDIPSRIIKIDPAEEGESESIKMLKIWIEDATFSFPLKSGHHYDDPKCVRSYCSTIHFLF